MTGEDPNSGAEPADPMGCIRFFLALAILVPITLIALVLIFFDLP